MPGHSKLTRLIAIGLTAAAVAPASASAMKDVSGGPAPRIDPAVARVAPRPHVLHRRGRLSPCCVTPVQRQAASAAIAPNGGGGADGPLIAAFAAALLAAAGGLVGGRRSRVSP